MNLCAPPLFRSAIHFAFPARVNSPYHLKTYPPPQHLNAPPPLKMRSKKKRPELSISSTARRFACASSVLNLNSTLSLSPVITLSATVGRPTFSWTSSARSTQLALEEPILFFLMLCNSANTPGSSLRARPTPKSAPTGSSALRKYPLYSNYQLIDPVLRLNLSMEPPSAHELTPPFTSRSSEPAPSRAAPSLQRS